MALEARKQMWGRCRGQRYKEAEQARRLKSCQLACCTRGVGGVGAGAASRFVPNYSSSSIKRAVIEL